MVNRESAEISPGKIRASNWTCKQDRTSAKRFQAASSAGARLFAEAMESRRYFDAALPVGFTDSLLVTGLSSPTAIDYTPDGRAFVCEQDGKVRVVHPDGELHDSPLLTVDTDYTAERGLLGLTLDPNFASNGYLYIFYTAKTPTAHNRVSRFKIDPNDDDHVLAGSETVLMDLPDVGGAIWHMGGAMHFGPDGKLYIAVGDQLVETTAGSLDSVAGKILRINSDGSIPTDDPFYNQTTGINRSIWAMGLRNPFTTAFGRQSGLFYINDVGGSAFEEVNQGAAGANFGWPVAEGPTNVAGMTNGVLSYPHTEGACVIGGAFYEPATDQFPASYHGKYFFGDFAYGWLKTLDPVTKAVTPFATGLNFPTGVSLAPDGTLWYLTRGEGTGGAAPGEGEIHVIRYSADQPAVITSQPKDVLVPVGRPATFTVGAGGTSPIAFQWFKGTTLIAGATTSTYSIASPTAADNGSNYHCVVTNQFGTATSRDALLSVTTTQAPVPTILTPELNTNYVAGQTITYSGSAVDAKDGTLPASAFSWSGLLHHDLHTHPFFGPITGVTSGTITIPTIGETSPNVWYEIDLTVTNSSGLSTTTSTLIYPTEATATFNTSPAGIPLTLDDRAITAPVLGVAGMSRTLAAPSYYLLNGLTYEFQGWSDGGAATHNILFPQNDQTFTALYRQRSTVYVSDLPFASTPVNNWGPIERDKSNGEAAAGDGTAIKLNGVTYAKGLGDHANSSVSFDLNGQYERFLADVGIDDEVGTGGSAIFQVWADGVKLYETPLLAGPSDTVHVSVDVTGKLKLKLVTDNGGDDATFDHTDWAAARLVVPLTPPPPVPPPVFVSDLPFVGTPTNGYGPTERDRSNGQNGATDGKTITLNGATYTKGLGVHAASEIVFNLGGAYTLFHSDVGIDDEEGNNGSVIFQVWADGVKLWESGVMKGSTATQTADVYVTGKQQLKLVVTNSGDNDYNDHADWAGATLTPTPGITPPGTFGHVTVEDDSEFEGDTGTTNLVFTVTRTTSDQAGSIAYATADGTATVAGGDYTSVSGVLNFAIGELSKTIAVPLIGDQVVEPDETFTLNLSNPVNLLIDTASAVGTIVSDDFSVVTIAGGSIVEGDSGTKNLLFTVSRTDALLPTVVTYQTSDLTALAGTDYVAQAGSVSFAAGELSKTISVVVNGDTTIESDETLQVQLLDATQGIIDDVDTAIGTIVNDDFPTISVADASVTEGNAGTADLSFVVTRSDATLASTVAWATGGGTATAGTDYTGASGAINFAAGELSKNVVVKVIGDTLAEGNETLLLTLSSPTNATIARAVATGTIIDDDGPAITIADASKAEGKSGTTVLTFTVSRTPGNGASSVQWSTANGTATTADADYVAASGTVSFAAGEISKTISVTINGDVKVETDETFLVKLVNPVNASLTRTQATGTIVNDDMAATVYQAESATLKNATVAKTYAGYTGTGYAKFNEPSAVGDGITWSPNVTLAGTRTLQFRYSNGGTAAKNLQLVINGVVVRTALSFATTGGWNKWTIVSLTVSMPAGVNSVKLLSTGGTVFPLIDSLTVS